MRSDTLENQDLCSLTRWVITLTVRFPVQILMFVNLKLTFPWMFSNINLKLSSCKLICSVIYGKWPQRSEKTVNENSVNVFMWIFTPQKNWGIRLRGKLSMWDKFQADVLLLTTVTALQPAPFTVLLSLREQLWNWNELTCFAHILMGERDGKFKSA